MNNEETLQAIDALGALCLSLSGKLAAQEAINAALLMAVGRSLPPLIPAISGALDQSHLMRNDLEEGSLASFDQCIANVQGLLRAIG